jgi:hypothetical protein
MKDRVSDLMIADTILPEQFMDTMRRSEAVQPEKALLIALLEDAIHNYRKYSTARDRAGKEHFHEAEHWIMHSRDHWIFSFENVCDLLSLDPEYLRRGLREWRARSAKHERRVRQQQPTMRDEEIETASWREDHS